MAPLARPAPAQPERGPTTRAHQRWPGQQHTGAVAGIARWGQHITGRNRRCGRRVDSEPGGLPREAGTLRCSSRSCRHAGPRSPMGRPSSGAGTRVKLGRREALAPGISGRARIQVGKGGGVRRPGRCRATVRGSPPSRRRPVPHQVSASAAAVADQPTLSCSCRSQNLRTNIAATTLIMLVGIHTISPPRC